MLRRLAVVLGVVLLVGCGDVESPGPSPTPSSVSPSPTPTLTPTPTPTPTPSPTAFPSYPADLPTEDPVKAAIIAGWQEYWRVYEMFAADPAGFTDFTETQYVTTGEASSMILQSLGNLKDKGLRSEGGREFHDVTVEIVEGEPSAGIVRYCARLEGLRVFDVATGERLPRSGALSEEMTLQEMPDGSWRVSTIRNETAQC